MVGIFEDDSEGESMGISLNYYIDFDKQKSHIKESDKQTFDSEDIRLFMKEIELKDLITSYISERIKTCVDYNGNNVEKVNKWIWESINNNINIIVGYEEHVISISPSLYEKIPKNVLVYPNGFDRKQLENINKRELT
jgi:hypothetical protein